MTGKSAVVLKNIFLLKSVIQQLIKIKITAYLYLITKAAKRSYICFAALYESTRTYVGHVNSLYFSALFPQNSI
jgi:hypothetical protein